MCLSIELSCCRQAQISSNLDISSPEIHNRVCAWSTPEDHFSIWRGPKKNQTKDWQKEHPPPYQQNKRRKEKKKGICDCATYELKATEFGPTLHLTTKKWRQTKLAGEEVRGPKQMKITSYRNVPRENWLRVCRHRNPCHQWRQTKPAGAGFSADRGQKQMKIINYRNIPRNWLSVCKYRNPCYQFSKLHMNYTQIWRIIEKDTISFFQTEYLPSAELLTMTGTGSA